MSGSALRRDLRVWLPALLVFLANVGAFGVYRVLYHGEVEQRRTEVVRAQARYDTIVEQRARAERLSVRAGRNQRRLTRLYQGRFKTQEQRVTKIIAEVKDLAERAGLDPTTLRYPDVPIESFGLIKRSIVFGVDGTYVSLRRFINLLEVSASFISLEEVRTSGSQSNGVLSIDLVISTLFLEEDVEPAALARSRDALGELR